MDIKDGNANFAVRSIVKSVNKKYADGNGNISLGNIATSVNGVTPDANGNINLNNKVSGAILAAGESFDLSWIPCPDGYSRDQCVFFAAMRDTGSGDNHHLYFNPWNGQITYALHCQSYNYIVFKK